MVDPTWEDTKEFTSEPKRQPIVDNKEQNQTDVPTWEGTEDLQEKYGTPGQQAITGLEAAGRGLVGPLAPMAETALGVDPEAIRGRQEASPITSGFGEVAGFVAPALLTGGVSAEARLGAEAAAEAPSLISKAAKLTQVGALDALGEKLGLQGSTTLAGKIGQGAAKAAIDNALLAGSDEASKMIIKDPSTSAETALQHIGLSAAIGAALGSGAGLAGGLWQSKFGDKAGQVAADFQSRMAEHVENPDPQSAITNELTNYYNHITSHADEVYGPQGLKAQDIAKAMPKMNDKIINQATDITNKLEKVESKLASDSNIGLLSDEINKYKQAITTDKPEEIFTATEQLKKQLQEWGRYNKDIIPLGERPFRDASKSLAYDLRTSLEDPNVWGKAAQRQQSINKAFSEYLPALKDFESKFMTKVGGERVIDPGKIGTYLSGLGKPRAEIKQTMLRNFLDASDKYKKVISDTHTNLGIDTPVIPTPLSATMSTLNEKTLGSKLADYYVSGALTDSASHGLGALIGGGLAHSVGFHNGIGAVLGATHLGSYIKSAIGGIAKSLLDKEANGSALKSAMDFAISTAKGESLVSKASKNLFKLGASKIATMPSNSQLQKLDRQLKEVHRNPTSLLESQNKLGHYLPDHSQAMDETVGRVTEYLNSIRPDTDPKAPLDSKPVPSSTQKANYENALRIAENPLLVLDKIKEGKITASDIHSMSIMYPSLYNHLKFKILDDMTNHIAKGNSIDYKTRIGLSLFLAQPLDSTMTPTSIIAAQPKTSSAPPPAQGPSPKKGAKSSPALQKMPGMFQTPSQSREAHKSKE